MREKKEILSVGELNPGLPRDRWGYLPLYFVVVFQSVSTENAYSAQMNGAIDTIYSLLHNYFKV